MKKNCETLQNTVILIPKRSHIKNQSLYLKIKGKLKHENIT